MLTANIFAIKRFEIHDGDGLRTTVFFKGCPLSCLWCHNPESLSSAPMFAFYVDKCRGCRYCEQVCTRGAHSFSSGIHNFVREKCDCCGDCVKICPAEALRVLGQKATVDEVLDKVSNDKQFYDCTGGGVTLSGGEPLLQSEYCAELLRRLKENNINTAIDTCLCVKRENIDAVLPHTDTFLVDVKAFSSELHKKLTGVGNELIKNNLEYLYEKGANIEIRVPLVWGLNHYEMTDIANYLAGFRGIRVKILSYHAYAHAKYSAVGMVCGDGNATVPTEEQMQSVRKIFADKGLDLVHE